MFLHLMSAEPRSGCQLVLRFDNSVQGEISLVDELCGELFKLLKGEALFMTVRLDPVMRTLVWSNGADFAPVFFYGAAQQEIACCRMNSRISIILASISCTRRYPLPWWSAINCCRSTQAYDLLPVDHAHAGLCSQRHKAE